MSEINRLIEMVNREIENITLPESPALLYHPINYSLSSGGKRIRPVLALIGCRIFSESPDNALYPAVALEIFHNFTLLHDDIMDRSPVRRGKPTVYKKWNENVAILSGDAMMIKAYEFVSKTPAGLLPRVFDIFNRTSLEVCEGQQYDMDFEKRNDVTINEYIRMIGLKTASLIASALKIGAVCGGAGEDEAELLYCYGKNLGIAFQLQDDLLDVYGDPGTFGKSSGNDICSNKKTYLLITALGVLQGTDKEKLLFWLGKEDFDKEEKIKAVKDIYNAANVKEITEKTISGYFSKAEKCLKELPVPGEKKQLLKQVSDLLFRREK